MDKLLDQNFKNYPFEKHPFFLMNHQELQDIITSPQEWGIDNVFFAKKILNLKGGEISKKEIKEYQETEIEKLQEGKSGKMSLYIGGFIAPLLYPYGSILGILSYAFLIAGFGIGANYYFDFTKSSTGQKFFKYNDKTRKIGLFILIWNILIISTAYIFTAYIINEMIDFF